MLRSAAKNHAFVAVVTSPSHYALVLHELREHGGTTLRTRRALAAQTFAITAAYDGAIARHFAGDCTSQSASEVSLPSDLMLQLRKVSDLRHGENPQQLGALYARASATALTHAHAPAPAQGLPDITTATQLHGKELSYNNLLDASAAIELAHALTSLCDKHASVFAQVLGAGAQPFGAAVGVGGDVGSGVGLGVGLGVGACVIKHTNPCGAAIALGAGEAVRQAIAGDPVAAYGGILAVGGRIDLASAETIVKKEHFFEVVAAPSFDEDALALLRSRWQNVRLLALPSWNPKAAAGMSAGDSEQPQQLELRTIAGGMLAQTKDVLTTELAQFAHAAGPAPTSDAIACGAFLEVVGKALLSNAVVLGGVEIASSEGAASQVGASAGGSANIDATTPRALRMYGAGAGQMDRVASCTLALLKAGDRARGAVAYSDAFFPFADGPTLLVQAGVRTIVHPGGSKRDSDTFALCNDRGVTCVTTGARHFRH
jgi:phosphoribosylaminoimidazolecarboxamide formyltransferase/IMP cyclohydrolase